MDARAARRVLTRGAPAVVRWATLLELGRVSNLPTVWSNVLAAGALAWSTQAGESGTFPWSTLLVCAWAGTLLYEGGMFLNDAYDAESDARERPSRPIPSGRATRAAVLWLGSIALLLGLASVGAAVAWGLAHPFALAAATFTAASVVAYDRFHKGFSWSPVLMGACRWGLYATAALAVTPDPGPGWTLRALALFCYVIGLTHVARFETGTTVQRAWVLLTLFAPTVATLCVGAPAWPIAGPFALAQFVWVLVCLRIVRSQRPGRIGKAVVSLIAGISWVDAAFAAAVGQLQVALVCAGAFALTLWLQRWVSGT